MRFYPHGGNVNLTPYLQTASLAISSSFLDNRNRPIPTASIALSADIAYQGPTGASGSNQTVTGPTGASGSTGATGPRGNGSYTGSLTTAICCNPYVDTFCVGVDLFTYDSSCQQVLSCANVVTCGGTFTECA